MDDAAILTAFREELIAGGQVRRPTEPGPAAGPPYPAAIEPRDGAPAPGELSAEEHDHNELVLSLFSDGEVAPADNYDAAARRRLVISVRYRSASNAALRAAMALDASIGLRLIRPETNYGYGFMLGTDAAIFAQAAGIYAGLSPLSRGRDRAYDDVAKYVIETAR